MVQSFRFIFNLPPCTSTVLDVILPNKVRRGPEIGFAFLSPLKGGNGKMEEISTGLDLLISNIPGSISPVQFIGFPSQEGEKSFRN